MGGKLEDANNGAIWEAGTGNKTSLVLIIKVMWTEKKAQSEQRQCHYRGMILHNMSDIKQS